MKTPKNKTSANKPFQPPTNFKDYWLYLSLAVKPVKKKSLKKKHYNNNYTNPLNLMVNQ